MKKIAVTLLLLGVMWPWSLAAQQLVEHPDKEGALSDRITWAKTTAQDQGEKSFWVAYGISKFMRKNSWIGRIGGDDWESRKSLNELLGRENTGEPLPDAFRRNLSFTSQGVIHVGDHHENDERYLKEIAVLVMYRSSGGRIDNPQAKDVYLTDMSLGVAFDRKPVYWLGQSTDKMSTDYLQRQFKDTKSADLRSDILGAIASHENRRDNLDFLSGILKSDPDQDIREDAAFWIGQLDIPQGLALLKETASTDKSVDVREKAIFSISQMSSEEAQNTLIDFAKHEKNRDVRKQAIFWLGQQASSNTSDVLEEMIFDEAETEVQEHAVHALAQMPADRSIPKLIEIATNHPNLSVRKKAIFWLGDSGDPRAVDVLIELAQKSN